LHRQASHNYSYSRQFALGFIFAFATLKKSTPMLTIAYIFFLVMFVGDFFIGISQKENSLIIAALVMCTISSALIFAINKRK
jgi:polyferredoxin